MKYTTAIDFWRKIVPEAMTLYNKGNPLIVAFRGNSQKTFLQNYRSGTHTIGNPFDFRDETGNRKEQGVTSTKKFIEWMVTGNNQGNENATEEYRQAIIKDIKSGELKGSSILYYEEKGYPTHATALDYLIQNWDKLQQPIDNKEEILQKQNIFTVTPIQSVDKKAIVKASVANKFIGFAEGITGSSTENYRQQILKQIGKKIPIVGDIVTINFEIDYRDVEVKAKILALEINLDENISNKGFSVDLENIKTGKKYGVYVNTDGTISQFEGKAGLRIGTDNYIKEFDIDSQKEADIVNSGNYSSTDVVFVSIGGKRGFETIRKEQQDKTIKEALKAIEAGATLITDNKSYVESSDYNEGEKRLAKNLEAKGYNYSEQTIDGQVLGVWKKTQKQPIVKENNQEITKEDTDKLPPCIG